MVCRMASTTCRTAQGKNATTVGSVIGQDFVCYREKAYMGWSKVCKLFHDTWLNILHVSQQEPSPVQLLQRSQKLLPVPVPVQTSYSANAPAQWRLIHRGCCLRYLLQQPNNKDSLQVYFEDPYGAVGVLSATSVCDFCCERVKIPYAPNAYVG